MKKVIAVDFDGTIIVEHKFPHIGQRFPFAKEVINRLYDEDYFIIIWTCRGEQSLFEMIKYLKTHGIKYHKINENAPYELLNFFPFPKVYADYYIDDRNIGKLPTWLEIYKIITGEEFERN